MRQKIEQLTTALIEDCLQSESPQDLFNALSRLEKGSQAILALIEAQQAVKAAKID
jgi:hypothetical protein